jgi:hypothetical protein
MDDIESLFAKRREKKYVSHGNELDSIPDIRRTSRDSGRAKSDKKSKPVTKGKGRKELPETLPESNPVPKVGTKSGSRNIKSNGSDSGRSVSSGISANSGGTLNDTRNGVRESRVADTYRGSSGSSEKTSKKTVGHRKHKDRLLNSTGFPISDNSDVDSIPVHKNPNVGNRNVSVKDTENNFGNNTKSLQSLGELRKAYVTLEDVINNLQPIEDIKLSCYSSEAPWFDLTHVSLLGRSCAPPEELAAAFLCPVSVIKRELSNMDSPFSIVYHLAGQNLRHEIRSTQIDAALIFKDTTMLKWLGKQLLKQKETIDIESNRDDEYLVDDVKRTTRMKRLDYVLREVEVFTDE